MQRNAPALFIAKLLELPQRVFYFADSINRIAQYHCHIRCHTTSNEAITRRVEEIRFVRPQFEVIQCCASVPLQNLMRQRTLLRQRVKAVQNRLIARSIHQHSDRAKGPFVPVNCGALTETLLEAELFGYLKGSFTGAVSDRRGLWEEAEGGTLFLDEIGETSPAMQVKLLRALQEKEIRRVGATRNTSVNARVVAATNRNLKQEVERGAFREDLYYRLSVFALHAPALRERRSDIPLLLERFLHQATENARRRHLQFADDTLRTLVAYDWPGNVRELESAIEYAALHARGDEIKPEDLPPELQSVEVREAAERSPLAALFDDLPTLDELERRYLLHVLKVVGGNRTATASVMGVDRRTLYRMANRFNINLVEGDPEAESL